MVKQYPKYFDDLFIIGIVFLFLIINYNQPLASIYQNMVYMILFGYIIPLIPGWSLFNWIPFSNVKNIWMELIVGIGAGVAFIYFYKNLDTVTPMAAVFATTAFGSSESVGRIVFGVLIPLLEHIFFFVIIPSWALWKIGKSMMDKDLFSMDKILLSIAIAAVFTWFHATSKGIENTVELMATFMLGMMSMWLTFFFKSVLPGALAHGTVNGYSVNLFTSIMHNALFSNQLIIIAGIGVIIYFISKRGIPFFN